MKKKIAVFMLFGQSNAVGHRATMAEEDIIDTPLANVYGLHRDPNQSFDTDHLTFSGYTSHGMNLAETQDNTYSVANCLARLWQDEIDGGNPNGLPDLYIVHIAIGSQGVYGMWNPDREKVLIPGKLGQVNISMYPLAVHTLELFRAFMEEKGLEPEFVGMHWRGGEQETRLHVSELEEKLKDVYLRLFGGLREAMGYPVPVYMHLMPFKSCMTRIRPTHHSYISMVYINALFEELCGELEDAHLFDVTRCPHYNPNVPDYGLLRPDLIHFTGETNQWVAAEIFREFKGKRQNTVDESNT